MASAHVYKQREYMRKLVAEHGYDQEKVCELYSQAEIKGTVPRKSNKYKVDPKDYAVRLWRDGIGKKGWLGN